MATRKTNPKKVTQKAAKPADVKSISIENRNVTLREWEGGLEVEIDDLPVPASKVDDKYSTSLLPYIQFSDFEEFAKAIVGGDGQLWGNTKEKRKRG